MQDKPISESLTNSVRQCHSRQAIYSLEHFSIMRHRFYDPNSKKARNNFIRQAIFFFIGWNGLGYLMYQYVKDSAREKDKDFDSKTQSMQFLSIIGRRDPEKIKYYRYTSKDGVQTLNPDGTVKVEADVAKDIADESSK